MMGGDRTCPCCGRWLPTEAAVKDPWRGETAGPLYFFQLPGLLGSSAEAAIERVRARCEIMKGCCWGSFEEGQASFAREVLALLKREDGNMEGTVDMDTTTTTRGSGAINLALALAHLQANLVSHMEAQTQPGLDTISKFAAVVEAAREVIQNAHA